MDSAHAEAAVLLIEAGADRSRVRLIQLRCSDGNDRPEAFAFWQQENLDGETPENVEGVSGIEQKRSREYVLERCGKA